MAKIGQNDVLAEFLHELIMRSSLIITDDKGTAHDELSCRNSARTSFCPILPPARVGVVALGPDRDDPQGDLLAFSSAAARWGGAPAAGDRTSATDRLAGVSVSGRRVPMWNWRDPDLKPAAGTLSRGDGAGP